MSRNLVIFLHGVGSNGADFMPLIKAWRHGLPNVEFEAPDAPHPFGHGAGREWFSVNGVTQANRPERVAAARAAFDHTLDKIVAAHGLIDQPRRLALVGFSQGAIMALDALASGRWPVAAVVAFSGRLASLAPLTPSQATRVLLVHGAADPVMPAAESVRAAALLKERGVDATSHILPDVGHTISQEGAALASTFLAAAFESAGKKDA